MPPVSCREAEGLVTELWPPRFLTMQWLWLCSQLCYVTAANQRSNCRDRAFQQQWVGSGAASLSAAHVALNVMHCRKEICSTWLCKESIPAIPFEISKHPLLVRSRFLRRTVCPSLQLQKKAPVSCRQAKCLVTELWSPRFFRKNLSHAEKQSVWSRSCGLQGLLRTIQWLIVLSVVLCDCCKPMNHCRDWIFSSSGLEVGLPAFQLPMFAKCDPLPQGDLCDIFVSGVHSCHPLPTRSLRLHHADSFVANAQKACLVRRRRGFGHGAVVFKNRFVLLCNCQLSF